MATITVKNIPDDLYARLKRAAQRHRRSINSEIIVCIERAVCSRRISGDEVLAQAQQLREKTEAHPLTDETLEAAKAAGRP